VRGGEGDMRVEVDMKLVPRSLSLCERAQNEVSSADFVAGNRVRLLFLYVPYSKQSNTDIDTGTIHSIAA